MRTMTANRKMACRQVGGLLVFSTVFIRFTFVTARRYDEQDQERARGRSSWRATMHRPWTGARLHAMPPTRDTVADLRPTGFLARSRVLRIRSFLRFPKGAPIECKAGTL